MQQCTFRFLLLLLPAASPCKMPLLKACAQGHAPLNNGLAHTASYSEAPSSEGCMPYLKNVRPARTPPAMSNSDMRTQTIPHPCGGKHLRTGAVLRDDSLG